MLHSIQEILVATNYTGSEKTKALLSEQIKERWGESELKNFDPTTNARTFKSWLAIGYRVKKGEKALRSITYIEAKDATGKVVNKYQRPVLLFYYRQVEKINHD